MTFDEFLGQCTACGGNWTQMILTGIERVAPDLYKQMPDISYTFGEACFIACHLCHDRPHWRYNRCIEHDRIMTWGKRGGIAVRPMTDEERNMSLMDFMIAYNGMTADEYAEYAKS